MKNSTLAPPSYVDVIRGCLKEARKALILARQTLQKLERLERARDAFERSGRPVKAPRRTRPQGSPRRHPAVDTTSLSSRPQGSRHRKVAARA